MPNYRDILIIKAEPRIEVLQTTCLLKSLAAKYPGERVIWVAGRRCLDILQGNPTINEWYFYEEGSYLAAALNRRFKAVISLETDKGMGDAANLLQAETKLGLFRDTNGEVKAFNAGAEKLKLWVVSQGKAAQLKDTAYQEILAEAAGMPEAAASEMVFQLPEESLRSGEIWREQRIITGRPLIGIYLGNNARNIAGHPDARSISFLSEKIMLELKAGVVVFAGNEEEEFLFNCMNSCPPGTVDGGCFSDFSQMAGMVEMCDIIIGVDCLEMQIALALGKKIVILQEADNPRKVELYGRGRIISSESKIEVKGGRQLLKFDPESVFSAVKALTEEAL